LLPELLLFLGSPNLSPTLPIGVVLSNTIPLTWDFFRFPTGRIVIGGLSGALRRSELVGIHLEHIKFDKEGITILLPWSKADQTGQGGKLYKSPMAGMRLPALSWH
jgi:hypothetical protein